MEETFEKLAEQITTKEELLALIGEINLIQRLIFKNTTVPLSEKIKERSTIEESFKKEIEELEKNKIISKDPEKNQLFFEKFKEYLKNLVQIKIMVAFRPKKEFIDKISLWLKKETGQKIILDLIFNPEIIGGAIMEYQGKRIDFSLAKEISVAE